MKSFTRRCFVASAFITKFAFSLYKFTLLFMFLFCFLTWLKGKQELICKSVGSANVLVDLVFTWVTIKTLDLNTYKAKGKLYNNILTLFWTHKFIYKLQYPAKEIVKFR